MILNKRILRELKDNWVRYSALAFLIIISIGLVVSQAGSSDAIFYTLDTNNEKNQLEDGEFSVYVPYTTTQVQELSNKGAKIEDAFYMDLPGIDDSTLRVFKNRENINTVQLDGGRLAEKTDEIVLEKHYTENFGVNIGDTITVNQKEYTVTGIGSTPDYINVLQNVSDVLSDFNKFSIAFVSEEEFNQLMQKDTTIEYNYSYQITGDLTDSELKDYLVDMDFDETAVTNKYMREIIDEIEKGKRDLSGGVNKLANGTQSVADGTRSLADGTGSLANGASELTAGTSELASGTDSLTAGLEELQANNGTINKAADEIFQALLAQVNSEFEKMGAGVIVTSDNYSTVINALISSIDPSDSATILTLNTLKGQLDGYKAFKDGLQTYTSGVESAYTGSLELSVGADTVNEGSMELAKGVNSLNSGTAKLNSGTTELNSGMGKFQSEVSKFITENMDYQYVNLITFSEAQDSQRITICRNDAATMKYAALMAGLIIITLLAYMISVFMIHTIDKESTVIGALYAMGYVKQELRNHFMILPMVIVSLASILGTVMGFLLVGGNIEMSSAVYYSYPSYAMVYPPYLLAYGILLPIFIAFIVNYIVIDKKLSMAPLKLLRREKKQHKLANIDLKNMGFINRYRIRQLLREIRGNITMFFGLFIAILLMMLGFCIYGSVDSYVNNTTKDVKYDYLYILKYPSETAPADSYKAYSKPLSAYLDLTGGDMDVTLQGIDDANPYFDFSLEGDKKEVRISNSVADKFGYRVGDQIILNDKLEDRSYSFTVKEIVDFASGLYIFMDIKDMRDLFEQEDDYYNTLMSDHELAIEAGRIDTVITVNEMVEASKQMYSVLSGTIIAIVGASIILFVIVMYLLLKMMIDKSTFSISLIKVFGYNDKEVKKLYLGSAFYTVVVTAIIAIPVSKMIVNKVYPYLVSYVSAGMGANLSPLLYLIIVGIIFISYLIVNFMAGRHLKKISLIEILKDRE